MLSCLQVAIVEFDDLKIHVYPPESTKAEETADGLYFSHALAAYELQELCDTSVVRRRATSGESYLKYLSSTHKLDEIN